MNLNSFKNFEKFDDSKKLNILFGAGQLGKLALYSLKQKKIKVDFFCDNDTFKQQKKFNNIEVISFDKLEKIKNKKNIFISNIYIEEIFEQISQNNDIDIFDCVELFNFADFSKFDRSEDKEKNSVFNHKTIDVERIISGYERKIETIKNLSKNKIILSHIDISITEKCSMKCKDCANLMQYYVKAENSNFNDLKNSITKILNLVTHINEVRVLGGEPFMNKEFYKVIEHIKKFSNISKIIVYTNATIVPRENNLECLKDDRVKVDITNYINLSKNHEKMLKVLKFNNIPHTTQTAKYWTDSGTIKFRNRKDSENSNVFKNCCVNDTFTLLNTKLYGCPFSAHAHNLKLIPKREDDYIDLQDGVLSEKEIRDGLYSFINRKKRKGFLTACGFCAGRDNTVKKINAAIQSKTPKVYNIKEDLSN